MTYKRIAEILYLCTQTTTVSRLLVGEHNIIQHHLILYQKKKYMQHLLTDISNLYETAQLIKNKKFEQGETFNIFNTLGFHSDEVRIHSPFIAELLNPKGSHGSAALFLKSFLEIINVEEDYINVNHCSTNILERVIGPITEKEGGRIDIIIEDGNHAIIIENKIYAGDQKKQMLRYNNYGKKNFPNGFKLIYLTLDGHEPEEYTLGKDKYEYKVLSYKKEIIMWLEKCHDIAKGKYQVQSILKQYTTLIKQLTYTDMDANYREQLKNITLSPENLLAVGEILKFQDEWMECLYEKFIWKPLEEFATSKGMNFDKDTQKGESGAWIYREEWKYYALFVWTNRKNDWYNMYVGVSWYKTPDKKHTLFKKDFLHLNCLLNEPCDGWPYGWQQLPDEIANWSYHITDKIIQGKVIDFLKGKFEQILQEIAEREVVMY